MINFQDKIDLINELKAHEGQTFFTENKLLSSLDAYELDFAVQAKESFSFQLWHSAIDDEKKTDLTLGNDQTKKHLQIKEELLKTLNIFGVITSYKIKKEEDRILASVIFDPDEVLYFYMNVDHYFPFKRKPEIGRITNFPEEGAPNCSEEKGIGYLNFGTKKQIKIGVATNQPFKVLRCLIYPFGTAKTVEMVYEAIRENPTRIRKTGIYTTELDRAAKIHAVQFAIKDLQKGKKLKNLKIKWDKTKSKLWLAYLP